ncbi:hypothetical protein FIV09_00040 [Roseivivax sp. THAF197b]|nr:hypothetical protein FIV09_00040 [Roseivivax sp. THAF197b]
MSKLFHFKSTVVPDWIDYNGHMRDSSYSLAFSLAVDAFEWSWSSLSWTVMGFQFPALQRRPFRN